MLGEALHHTHIFRPLPADSTWAAFDSVLRRDSTLFPALIHPVEVALLTRDSSRFARYYSMVERSAPSATLNTLRTAAQVVWGPPPSDSALRAALIDQPSWIINAVNSGYELEHATSDSILRRFRRAQQVVPRDPNFLAQSLGVRSYALAGLGRWREAGVLIDSLRSIDRGKATEVLAWSTALGLAPASFRAFLDTAVAAIPPGPEAEYARAMAHLLRGEVGEGRRWVARSLAAGKSESIPESRRGYLVAVDGWAALLQGDSTTGLPRLREGIQMIASPREGEESAFLRFQLARTLAAAPENRTEGITWLREGFDLHPLYQPLTHLELGRTYEAVGKTDSAALAYRKFLRFWDKADPDLQGRVTEARQALEELTRERPSAR
jgi:hypothetical protein